MKSQLEHFQETGDYLLSASSAIATLQNLIDELEQKISVLAP
jgi:hypothetical protein